MNRKGGGLTPAASAIVEVGGTKTSFRLVNSRGAVIRKKILPSDPARLKSQIKKFLKSGGRREKLVAGIRGVWTEPEKRCWRKELRGLAKKISVMSDIELAFVENFPKGCGIILNAGTGSIAYGRSPSGKTARAGGLGPMLGDEGSAFWIGKEYLRRGPLAKDWKKVRAVAKSSNPVAEVAGFSRIVLAQAAHGDRLCRSIVDQAQGELAKLADNVRKELGGRKVPLKLAGGLFENKFFLNRFLQKWKKWLLRNDGG